MLNYLKGQGRSKLQKGKQRRCFNIYPDVAIPQGTSRTSPLAPVCPGLGLIIDIDPLTQFLICSIREIYLLISASSFIYLDLSSLFIICFYRLVLVLFWHPSTQQLSHDPGRFRLFSSKAFIVLSLDSQYASTFYYPGLYSMSVLYCVRISFQRENFDEDSSSLPTHCRGLI